MPKFRAWNKTKKEMRNVSSINFLKGTVGLGREVVGWHLLELFEPLGNINLMQSTELKDKNGTEIYQDDLLSDEDGNLYQVCWQDCMWINKELKTGYFSNVSLSGEIKFVNWVGNWSKDRE